MRNIGDSEYLTSSLSKGDKGRNGELSIRETRRFNRTACAQKSALSAAL